MSAALLHDLCDHLGGHIVTADHGPALALPHGGIVYASFTGTVRLQRYGLPVVTLGTLTDGAGEIAAVYRELTAVKSA